MQLDLWATCVVPKTIDGEPQTSLAAAVLMNASLLLLFALQHSIMARPAFKQLVDTHHTQRAGTKQLCFIIQSLPDVVDVAMATCWWNCLVR